ncbi:phage scaffolding protein [Latilactobacillus sakei]
MKREDLKELKLSDEQIEGVMGLHGQTVNDLNNQIQTLTTEKDSLTDQVTQSTQQLEGLKDSNKDNEVLQSQIVQLQADNEQLKSDSEVKLAEAQKGFALENALRDAGARDVKAVKPFLDETAIKLDGDKLLGLDDQLKAVKENKDFLFQSQEPEQKTKINAFAKGDPSDGDKGDSIAAALGLKQQ